MRGFVESWANGEGVIAAEDGSRHRFVETGVRGDLPGVGDRVDFVVEGDLATEIVRLARQSSWSPVYARDTLTSIAATPATSPWGYFVRCITSHYARFEGRASRPELWWFVLFRYLLMAGAMVPAFLLGAVAQTGPEYLHIPSGILFFIAGLFYLGTLIPNLTAVIRRLHDIGLSGWLVLLNMIPYVGPLAVFVMTVIPTQQGRNDHGHPPGKPPVSVADTFA